MQSNMSSADADFMAMLNDAGVTAAARWADVTRRCAGDPRFKAAQGERKLTLFRDYVRVRQEVDDMQLPAAEKDFMVRQLRPGRAGNVPHVAHPRRWYV